MTDTPKDPKSDHAEYVIRKDDMFTSDPHFGHTNVIKYCNRPFCCKHQMNEVLIQKWNLAVKPHQRVFILGDTFFGNKGFMKRTVERLNGYKIVIKGNHCPGRNALIDAGFNEAHLTADATFEDGGKDLRILMRHIPDRENNEKYDIHLCGHVHQAWAKSGNIINVGMDIWDYEPRRLKFILDHAEEYQRKLPTQQTVDESWEGRNDELIAKMYKRNVVPGVGDGDKK